MPRIEYPPNGATLDLSAEYGTLAPLALEAAGGHPPYRRAVNGVRIPSGKAGKAAYWQPDGPGFSRVTVHDQEGRHASVRIRVAAGTDPASTSR